MKTDQFHIDILTAHFVQHPDWFDVVVGSNLFGDILSDLGPADRRARSASRRRRNINPEKEYPSMFEPVHGSAPDIAGKGIANPIGQIWTGAMMLEHFGIAEAARAVERAIETVCEKGPQHARFWRQGLDTGHGQGDRCRCLTPNRQLPTLQGTLFRSMLRGSSALEIRS